MSQFEKLLQRIKSLDKNMRFDEIRKILEAYGYTTMGPLSRPRRKKFIVNSY